jgi:hypothetical protein
MVALQDMADVTRVQELLDLIYLSRASGRADALHLEEALYYELVDLLRSPETLLRVTGRRVEVKPHLD